MLSGLFGTVCCGELLKTRSGSKLLKLMVGLSAISFLFFNVSIMFNSHNLILAATALFGLVTAPVFLLAYEQGADIMQAQGVSEAFTCNLVNSTACLVSAIQHFILLYRGTFTTGLFLISLNIICSSLTLMIIRKHNFN